jgi:hypothetical protein
MHSLHSNLSFAGRPDGQPTLEDGHNRGEVIDRLEKVWGLSGEPYCAMGQAFNLCVALLAEWGQWPLPKGVDEAIVMRDLVGGFIGDHYLNFSPAVAEMVKDAVHWKQFHAFHQESDVRGISPGDYVTFNFGTRNRPQNHIGQFWKWDGSHMWLVEWNTSAQAEGDKENDPKHGGGCFVKERPADPTYVMGWIHWQG